MSLWLVLMKVLSFWFCSHGSGMYLPHFSAVETALFNINYCCDETERGLQPQNLISVSESSERMKNENAVTSCCQNVVSDAEKIEMDWRSAVNSRCRGFCSEATSACQILPLRHNGKNKASTCYLSPLWAMFPFPSLSPI